MIAKAMARAEVESQVVCFGIEWSGWNDGALLAMGGERLVGVERMFLERRALLLVSNVFA